MDVYKRNDINILFQSVCINKTALLFTGVRPSQKGKVQVSLCLYERVSATPALASRTRAEPGRPQRSSSPTRTAALRSLGEWRLPQTLKSTKMSIEKLITTQRKDCLES